MGERFNKFLERVADYLADRPGFLPLLGILFVIFNFVLQIYPGSQYWLVDSHLFLHLGIVISIVGLLLIRPFG